MKCFLAVLTTAGLVCLPAAHAGSKNKKNDIDAIGERGVGSGVNWYSIQKEIALGKQLAQEIKLQAKTVDDPIISEYVNRLGQNLVRNSDAKVPFTIEVLDSQEPNALSLPGGFLFVNSGLLLLADSESEVAGAMSHEIAHVAARHGTRQATRAGIANLASIPLILMGGWAGYGVRQAANVLIPVQFLKFSRGFEREADSLGLQYMYKTGYDPNSLVVFFERLQSLEKKKPGTIAKIFSTHPMTKDRVAAAQKEIQQELPPRSDYVVNTSEFQQVKARLAALHPNRKTDSKDPDRPKLRRTSSTGAIPADDEDGRPTLKRR